MSKPAGKCVICDERRSLTKGHVWPEWIKNEMGFDETHHVEIISHTYSTSTGMQGPSIERQLRQGHGTSKRRRNTCADCNNGWMSQIENAAKPVALPLMRGENFIIEPAQQTLLASLFCLITIRNEFSRLGAVAVPKKDRDHLRTTLLPPENWRIWIARYGGANPKENWAYHQPMHLASGPTTETGPDKANTQTTTLVVGQLCAHTFSSTVIDDFPDYVGIELCRIWPPSTNAVDWRLVHAYDERALLSLSEALARDIPSGNLTS